MCRCAVTVNVPVCVCHYIADYWLGMNTAVLVQLVLMQGKAFIAFSTCRLNVASGVHVSECTECLCAVLSYTSPLFCRILFVISFSW